jgi:hypothetical protein
MMVRIGPAKNPRASASTNPSTDPRTNADDTDGRKGFSGLLLCKFKTSCSPFPEKSRRLQH